MNNTKLSRWVREIILFILISNVVIIFKSLFITFLAPEFAYLGTHTWCWPNIELELFGKQFIFNVVGYDEKVGGFAYLVTFFVASFVCEIINFFMQRSITFRSKGNIVIQGIFYFLAWGVLTVTISAVTSIWTGVAVAFFPDTVYHLLTSFILGGVPMILFFFVNKLIFAER